MTRANPLPGYEQVHLYQRICSATPACLLSLLIFSSWVFSGWIFSGWVFGEQAAIAAPFTEIQTEAPAAEALFDANCAACHANGSNIIRRGKNLKQKALSRYGYNSAEAIESLVSQGKGAMPSYADRLDEGEIGAIAQYVLTQAEAGW